jgi:hypothetical protein
VKWRRIRNAGHVASMGRNGNAYKILMRKLLAKREGNGRITLRLILRREFMRIGRGRK